MDQLEPRDIECPYCGETIEVLIDGSELPAQYIEDCQVCCRPINFDVSQDYEGDVLVRVTSDDE
ncbi:CPXCG motif-containing cysteine-rich protein [Leucothrix mucor]|jgi:hypothetical protein|uniref:CPXCG motif-containing cysteine-rich protein n=1 Tax=Leucothrix mucor TaxID=45248 RepID=UPI0003B758A0|nr:CPXCG motif-containing cysteine-rich protein [Leucothrix mucor]